MGSVTINTILLLDFIVFYCILFIYYVTLMGFYVEYFNFLLPFVNNCFVTYLKPFIFCKFYSSSDICSAEEVLMGETSLH